MRAEKLTEDIQFRNRTDSSGSSLEEPKSDQKDSIGSETKGKTVECPRCSSPVRAIENVDFLYCGKRDCRLAAAQMYQNEVTSLNERVTQLIANLEEAQQKIAEQEVTIALLEDKLERRPKTWDDFEKPPYGMSTDLSPVHQQPNGPVPHPPGSEESSQGPESFNLNV